MKNWIYKFLDKNLNGTLIRGATFTTIIICIILIIFGLLFASENTGFGRIRNWLF